MKKLKGQNLQDWLDKNSRLNEEKQLKLGMEVIDRYCDKGIVVKIVEGDGSIEGHGTIYVWQSEKYDFGSDNCQHYAFDIWKRELRILNEP